MVNDDKGNEYYISVKKDRYSPWSFNLWNNINTESIRGRWDDTKGIFIRECVNLSTKYNITYTIIRTPIELVHNSLFDNQEKCELIIQEFNKTYFNPLKERITNEIKLINSKINLCQNFENNLFTDTFFYLAEITTKLLNSANKLKQLLVKLDEQKKRYDESE